VEHRRHDHRILPARAAQQYACYWALPHSEAASEKLLRQGHRGGYVPSERVRRVRPSRLDAAAYWDADRAAALHNRLVRAYRAAGNGELFRAPNDGYAFDHLAAHVFSAEGAEALHALLFDVRWLKARLEATDVNRLLADFELQPTAETETLKAALLQASHLLSHKDERWSVLTFLLHRSRAAAASNGTAVPGTTAERLNSFRMGR